MPEYNEKYLKTKQAAVDRARERSDTATSEGRDRLPPGQSLTTKFPVLDLGVRPEISLEEFRLTISGEVEHPFVLDWEGLTSLPKTVRPLDFHCVTRWSQLDITWGGVLFSVLCDLVKPRQSAHFILEYGRDGYTTNVSLEEMMHPDVMIAYELEGGPIPLEHGGPVRSIVPHLYAWKSAKFLNSITFSPVDRPGFWEERGYHNHGDPWTEERFS